MMRKTHVLKILSFVSIETNNLQMTTGCKLRKSMSVTGTFYNFHCDIAGNDKCFPNRVHSHWLLQGYITSNNEAVSRSHQNF